MLLLAILLLLRAFGISTGLGSVTFETTVHERGEPLIWLEERVLNKLRLSRGTGESYSDVILRLADEAKRQRCSRAASGLSTVLALPLALGSLPWRSGEGRLFPASPPALAPEAVRQSKLRLDIGERSQELLLDLQGIGFAGEFRLRGALKGRLNEGLALGAPHEAPACELSRSLGELVKGKVPIEIPRETFTHPPLRLTKPMPADEIRDDKERNDERRRAYVDCGSFIHTRRPQFRQ